jgi:hypothetical protein
VGLSPPTGHFKKKGSLIGSKAHSNRKATRTSPKASRISRGSVELLQVQPVARRKNVKKFDSGTERFIAEFLHDAERSEGNERAHCKVMNGQGDDQVLVILQVDGKPVATHLFSRASEEWREFRRNLANRLGITSPIDFGVPLRPFLRRAEVVDRGSKK